MTTTRAYVNATATATATTALPVGSAVADLCVAVVNSPAAATLSLAGWNEATPAGGVDVGGGLSHLSVFSKVLTQADLDQTVVPFVRASSSAPYAAVLASFPGFTAVNAVSASASFSATNAVPYPAVTPLVDGSLVVAANVSRSTTATIQNLHTQPTGWTFGAEASNVVGPAVLRTAWLDYVQLVLGAGVPFSATASVAPAGNGGSLLLALTPAAAPSVALLHPNSEQVAVAWLKAAVPYLGARVATELPMDNSTWSASGFTTVTSTGGSPDIYLPVAHPVVSIDCYGVSSNGGRPPWNLAAQMAEQIRRAALAHATVPRWLPVPAGFAPARVLGVIPRSEPRRLPGDVSSYARFQMDLEIWWTE